MEMDLEFKRKELEDAMFVEMQCVKWTGSPYSVCCYIRLQ